MEVVAWTNRAPDEVHFTLETPVSKPLWGRLAASGAHCGMEGAVSAEVSIAETSW